MDGIEKEGMCMIKYLLKSGIIIDGTGAPQYLGDILINGGKISEIGDNLVDPEAIVIDCNGLCISPGFIDCHSHSDMTVLFQFNAFNILEQGITTEVSGHCGISIAPIIEEDVYDLENVEALKHWLSIKEKGNSISTVFDEINAMELPTNMAFFLGHGAIRRSVMNYSSEKPTYEQLEKMKMLVREGMSWGAIGLSSGLIYPPGSFSDEQEMIELCHVVSEYKGIYASHMRSESDGLLQSMEETIRVGDAACVPILISHHKVAGKHNRGKSVKSLALIDEGRSNGLHIGLDQYPYNGGATALIRSIPPHYSTAGKKGILEHLRNAQTRKKIEMELSQASDQFENLIYLSGGLSDIIVSCEKTKLYNFMTIGEISKIQKKNEFDTMFDLLLENEGDVEAIYPLICDWDIDNIMKHPLVMGGVDGAHMNQRGEKTHPRQMGTFPKIIGTYCRDKKLFTIEECIRKLTGLPAEFFGFTQKGLVRVDMDADLVVFDFSTIEGCADYISSNAPNCGIRYVFVNGSLAVKNGTITGVKNGQVIRKHGA
jgi:N-acyl-D-amino-acid deacylase